eukprot:2010437-Amphidinium_carterae.1
MQQHAECQLTRKKSVVLSTHVHVAWAAGALCTLSQGALGSEPDTRAMTCRAKSKFKMGPPTTIPQLLYEFYLNYDVRTLFCVAWVDVNISMVDTRRVLNESNVCAHASCPVRLLNHKLPDRFSACNLELVH